MEVADFDITLAHIPRQTLQIFLNGVAVRCFCDTGASESFIAQSKAADVSAIRKLRHALRLRLAEGKLSSTVLDTAVQGVQFSALNGEVSEKVDLVVMPSMPAGCDMIAGRNVLFGVLHAAVHEKFLECYTEHQPDPESSPVKTPVEMRKCLPFIDAGA
jgi:hypothetical protein